MSAKNIVFLIRQYMFHSSNYSRYQKAKLHVG